MKPSADLPPDLAHELRTPLTGIYTVLNLLDEQKIGKLNDTQASLVEQALEDCTRLRECIDVRVRKDSTEPD